MRSAVYAQIYGVVRRIPRGRVATYGQVARLAGLGGHARLVGYALSALHDDDSVPWHRVINSRGEVSARSDPYYEELQRALLSEEGIRLDEHGRLPLRRYRWTQGPGRARPNPSCPGPPGPRPRRLRSPETNR